MFLECIIYELRVFLFDVRVQPNSNMYFACLQMECMCFDKHSWLL